jgi:hypothetical protein
LNFDAVFYSNRFVIIGCAGFGAKFRIHQDFNPESQVCNKLYFSAKNIEFIVCEGRHKADLTLCYYVKSRIERVHFQA